MSWTNPRRGGCRARVEVSALGQGLGERSSGHVPNVGYQAFLGRVEVPLGRWEPREAVETRDSVLDHGLTPGVENALSKAVALDTVRLGRGSRDGLVVVPLVDKGRNPGAS